MRIVHVCLGLYVDGAIVIPEILLPIPLPAAGLDLGIVPPVQRVRCIAEGIRLAVGWRGRKKHSRNGGSANRKQCFLHDNPLDSPAMLRSNSAKACDRYQALSCMGR